MADFLTECPGSSVFPEEEVVWKPVDASEPELEKAMATLSMKTKEEKAEPSPTFVTPVGGHRPPPQTITARGVWISSCFFRL